MKITQQQLRQIIREELLNEALKYDDVDWQQMRTMRSGDVPSLPADQQRLAQVAMSTRDPSGRELGLARASGSAAKIFEVIEALRDSESYESWDAAADSILKRSDEFSRKLVKTLIREINDSIRLCASYFTEFLEPHTGAFAGMPYSPRQKYTDEFWDTIKDWSFRHAMISPTVRTHNLKTGSELFPEAQLLQTDPKDDVRQALGSRGRGVSMEYED